MRNLVEYPVTSEEVLGMLENSKIQLPGDSVGDMRPLLMSYLLEYLRLNKTSLDEFLETKKL